MNCKELTQKINLIKFKRTDFDQAFLDDDVKKSVLLKKEIESLIKEIKEEFLSLEILKKENLERQCDQWSEVYKDLDKYTSFPSKERVINFINSDPKFLELMQKKEKQGFTKLVIAPAPGFHSLEIFLKGISRKVEESGGKSNFYGQTWLDMFAHENQIHYFGSIDDSDAKNPIPTGGVTGQDIRNNPEEFSVCDGWLISFASYHQQMVESDESDVYTGGGRMEIKTGFKAKEYEEKYFSDKDEIYMGERSMIPQEYFALFAKKLFENYIKLGKKIETTSRDLSDGGWRVRMRFNDTYLPGLTRHPDVVWHEGDRGLDCEGAPIDTLLNSRGVRSVVRRSIKQ